MNIVEKFIENPKNLDLSANKLATRWNVTKEEIVAAKALARQKLLIDFQQDVKDVTYIGYDIQDNEVKKTYHSPAPLSPDEIQKLVGVDGVTSKISKVTDRLLPNGNWVYTVEIKTQEEFYSSTQLEDKLRKIFPKVLPAQVKKNKAPDSHKMAVVAISDDHVGCLNEYSLFGNEWSADIYEKRLLSIIDHLRSSERVDEIQVLSLGDQMNGWNSQTTRGGHEVKSLSNKEQFDIYTSARVKFYDTLFTSGLAKTYKVHDVENSNHTGSGFSYMANRFLDLYLSQRFPFVERKSYFHPIEMISYGVHTIGFTHGKDEAIMTKGLPFKLDTKTDLFLYQYFDARGIAPAKSCITVYKGDLHSYNIERGKFGRYVNVPSIMGSSTWSEVNFGNTFPGCVIDIYNKESPHISHRYISF